MTFLIIFLVALAVSAVGFHRYIWFISIGYGFSIAAIGTALLIMFMPYINTARPPNRPNIIFTVSFIYLSSALPFSCAHSVNFPV